MAEEEVEEKGGSKLIIIIGAVVALGGGGAFMMMGGDKKGGEAEVEKVIELEVENIIEGGITITFLDDEGANSYLLLNISFTTKTEKSGEYLMTKMSRIKRDINIYLYNLQPEDIRDPSAIERNEGKFFVILDKVLQEGELGKGHELKNVYITKYIIQ